jgi:CHAT domain-containing protein
LQTAGAAWKYVFPESQKEIAYLFDPLKRDSIEILTRSILDALTRVQNDRAFELAAELERAINNLPEIENLNLSRPFYSIGLSYYKKGYFFKSLDCFNKALEYLNKFQDEELLGKTYYNLATVNFAVGDDVKSIHYYLLSCEIVRKLRGENTAELATDYNALLASSINMRDNDGAVEYATMGIAIARSKPDSVAPGIKALLYQNKAIALSRMADHFQSLLNFREALDIYRNYSLPADEYYVNLLEGLAESYINIGEYAKAFEIYENGIKSFGSRDDFQTFIFKSRYADNLAQRKLTDKARKVYEEALDKLKNGSSAGERDYAVAVSQYADFLRKNRIDVRGTLELYKSCFEYTRKNPWDIRLNRAVSIGYALSLLDNNMKYEALDSVNSILWRDAGSKPPDGDPYENPAVGMLKQDIQTTDLLFAKYEILRKIAGSPGENLKYVDSEVKTAELIISVIEPIRLNIGEEQSRLVLGNKFRNAYINVISSFISLYQQRKDPALLDKAFEYSEKSKAASLLASLRERKAKSNLIPPELLETERRLSIEFNYYNAKYEEEQNSENPDPVRLNLWQTSLLRASWVKDSLKGALEKKYPEYAAIKSNAGVVNPKEISRLTYGKSNYLSYVISDSLIYIFLVNRKGTFLESVRIDTTFSSQIRGFRSLLSEPGRNRHARSEFEYFQRYGFQLYSQLINPVRDKFTSNRLVISPDYMLAFFPFEIMVTEPELRNDRLYGRLPYLMNDFDISYAYSATLLAESGRTRNSLRNRSLSFAPVYDTVYIDSLTAVNRQQESQILTDLKFAREEAAYVSMKTKGELYLNEFATKHRFLEKAGGFPILHMAMHTVLNSRNPVNSGLIFYEKNSKQDSILTPYEVYSLPLDAKMVVLSSCYTGSGTLYTGEGVLSLARGFIFSGSRSVVMSLWEVDDRSGTEIIKTFYRQLKAGKPKSEALREARLKYLSNSDMLGSHPYFWSTMVIYGDDSPLYVTPVTKFLFLLIPALLIFYIFSYLKKR